MLFDVLLSVREDNCASNIASCIIDDFLLACRMMLISQPVLFLS